MSSAMLEHQGPWTFEEFVQLEGEHGERFELVDYAEAGIPAYWRVETDPVVEMVAMQLEDGSYREVLRATGGTVDVPGGWRIDLDVVRQE